MEFVKVINGVVVQKSCTPEVGFIEAPDGVCCEYLYDGVNFTAPPIDHAPAMRMRRDSMIDSVAWRYERHARELRLGLTPTDNIGALDTYTQALADVPNQTGFPNIIVWPVL